MTYATSYHMTLHDAIWNYIALHCTTLHYAASYYIPFHYNTIHACVYIYIQICWRGCLVPSGGIDCKRKMRKGSWRCFTPRLKRYFRWKRKESDDTILYSQRMHQWSKNDEWHSDVHPQSGITKSLYTSIYHKPEKHDMYIVFLQKSMVSMAKCQSLLIGLVQALNLRPALYQEHHWQCHRCLGHQVWMLKITIPYINGLEHHYTP